MHIHLLQPPPLGFLMGLKSRVPVTVDTDSGGHNKTVDGAIRLWKDQPLHFPVSSLPLASALPETSVGCESYPDPRRDEEVEGRAVPGSICPLLDLSGLGAVFFPFHLTAFPVEKQMACRKEQGWEKGNFLSDEDKIEFSS